MCIYSNSSQHKKPYSVHSRILNIKSFQPPSWFHTEFVASRSADNIPPHCDPLVKSIMCPPWIRYHIRSLSHLWWYNFTSTLRCTLLFIVDTSAVYLSEAHHHTLVHTTAG